MSNFNVKLGVRNFDQYRDYHLSSYKFVLNDLLFVLVLELLTSHRSIKVHMGIHKT